MNSAIEVEAVKSITTNSDWSLWLRQIRAILKIDIRKNFWGRRALLLYLLAALPVVLMLGISVVWTDGSNDIRTKWASAQEAFGYIYGALILRTVVFFGCAWIFMNLFRGEIVDRSLHYYFLSSVRREVLLIGKYFSGLVTSIILFTGTTVVAMPLLYFPHLYS